MIDSYFTDGQDMFIDPDIPTRIWCCGYRYVSPDYLMSVAMSDNSGSTWTRWDLGTSIGRAYTIERDPSDPDIVYVGGYEGSSTPALYRTVNGGSTWNPLPLSGLSGYIYDLALDPASDAGTIYAATGSGVYKSTDSGSSWTKVSSFTNARALLMDPDDSQVLYAATYSNGVYTTTDGGSTWTPMNAGLGSYRTTCFGLNPGDWLFAGTYGGAMYRWSLDTGTGEAEGASIGTVPVFAAPNPAQGGTTIHYRVTGTEPVELTVYDMQGRLVEALVDGTASPGEHQAYWNASEVPPGVYFFVLRTGTGTETGRLVLIP